MTVPVARRDTADARPKRISSPRLVGRAHELDLLVSAVTQPPAAVVLEGEAGSGKTRLVAELRTRPELAEMRFVLGAGRRIREPFPLGPIIDAVRALAAESPWAGLSPLAGALRPLLPELAAALPPAPEPLDDPAAERHRVFRALAELLGAVGRAVLVLEDLHWADEQTLDFLTYLLGDPPAGLSLLLSYRTEDATPGVRALTARLPAATAHAHVILPRMDRKQAGELTAAILGVERISEDFAGYLRERASGLPFAIEELLALLQANGQLARRKGGWAVRELDQLDVPTGIRDQVLERVAHLSGDARAAVEAAAVLRSSVPLDVVVATCLVPTDRALRGLDEALESGLLAEYGELVGFRHVLAGQAVEEALPGTRRRRLHSQAASTLEEYDPVPLGQLAHHLRHAGRLGEWVVAAERAADQAAALRNDAEAVRLLEDVVRHGPLAPAERARLAVKLGWAALETVRTTEVVALLQDVMSQDGTEAAHGEIRFLLASTLNVLGEDVQWQRDLFATAIGELADRPDLRARATAALGVLTASSGTVALGRDWLYRSMEVLAEVSDPMVRVFVLGKVGMGLVTVGDPAWRQVLQQVEAATAGSVQSRAAVNAYFSIGAQCCYLGHHDVAERLLTSALSGAVACENRRLQLLTRSALTLLSFLRGNWDSVADGTDALLDALADYPLGWIEAELAVGGLALAQGRLDDAQHRLAGAGRLAEELGLVEALAFPASGLARIALARGDTAAALGATERCLDALRAKDAWAAAAPVLPTAVESLIASGRVWDAGELLRKYRKRLEGLDVSIAPAALRHAEGLLAAVEGNATQLVEAAVRYDALPYPYLAALAREQAALVLLDAGEQRAGSAELALALETYQRLGADWDHSRATGAARQRGLSLPGKRRAGRPAYGNDLSARERDVAVLAATGRSNKEIAAELFLSVYTVEQHVGAVLRKLGIRSRAGIASRLSG
ncbi:AAA family ATPase [Micromonospora sp. MW-13]|uniref:helix-turn-helix transcriptional regulator n=1 Tax=Micromonospora sp. MW-13 TaxID=2094022 RepID=UPI0014046212|nr:AAA family ATPase [Micromonospora sp. MW-13]